MGFLPERGLIFEKPLLKSLHSPPRSTLWTSINCELSSSLTLLFSPLLLLFFFKSLRTMLLPSIGGEPIKCLVLFKLSAVVFPNSLGF